jgi:hypothetical protein
MQLCVLLFGAVALRSQTIEEGTTFNHDLVSFEPEVRVDGTVKGDIAAVGGKIDVNGVVTGDIVAFASEVNLAPTARLQGDVIVIGGELRGATPQNVQGRIIVRGSGTDSTFGVSHPFLSYALQLTLLAGWLIAAIVITLLSGREVRSSSLEMRASLMHTFTLGLVAITSFVLTLIVCGYLVPYLIGIPLIIAIAVIAIVVKVFGMIAVFHAVGAMLFAPRDRAALNRSSWMRGDLALTIAGFLILGALRLIPMVGLFIWMVASVFGVGTALATRFGRREPWFLAVRQVTY